MKRSGLQDEIDRVLTPEEARRYLETPITEAERAEVRALYHWFTRRYPSPLERLAYVRQAYARWQGRRAPADG